MWVQLPYQRQKGGRQYVEAHWGEAQAALELLEALIEEISDKLQSKVDVHVSPRKYRKEFFWSIINSPGIALTTLKIIFCVEIEKFYKNIAQKNVENSQCHIQGVNKCINASK